MKASAVIGHASLLLTMELKFLKSKINWLVCTFKLFKQAYLLNLESNILLEFRPMLFNFKYMSRLKVSYFRNVFLVSSLSSKKRTKTSRQVVKLNLFVHLFARNVGLKKSFQIYMICVFGLSIQTSQQTTKFAS